jgi:hypothetical protein
MSLVGHDVDGDDIGCGSAGAERRASIPTNRSRRSGFSSTLSSAGPPDTESMAAIGDVVGESAERRHGAIGKRRGGAESRAVDGE